MSEPISVTTQLPKDGQFIIGRSELGFWIEEFDRSEPIGGMLEWKPTTETDYYLNICTSDSLKRLWEQS